MFCVVLSDVEDYDCFTSVNCQYFGFFAVSHSKILPTFCVVLSDEEDYDCFVAVDYHCLIGVEDFDHFAALIAGVLRLS